VRNSTSDGQRYRIDYHCVAGCTAKLTSTPCNTVATLQQHDPVVLTCKTDKSGTGVTWSFGENTNLIFNGFDTRENFVIETDVERGEFNVTLSSLDASHAGRYICVEPGTDQRASAQLTILGKFVLFCSYRVVRKLSPLWSFILQMPN